jgi:serine/threonine-protein kinase
MTTMGSDRWHLVSARLEHALDLPEEERGDWLARLAADDPQLAGEVEALLAEHRAVAAERFLEGRVAPIEAQTGSPGQQVGAYTLVSPIGEGGMGRVWLAARNDGRFERQVAVKFLDVTVAGSREGRFRREGIVLARLTHSHIAQLVDAGVLAAGQPYLILEYVDGLPIDRYCEEHRLDVAARVRLFLDVLSAVAHAHANLIVHRDIKPSNVFVDRYGNVKLLDFGIAKLLEEETQAVGATLLTREGGVAMTPEYAAPEQMMSAPITTATDVYALGVLFYVVLTGVHPAGAALRSPAGIVKAIVETEPPLMSAAAVQPALARALKGDLDTIVAKALKKNPAERYTSVTAFAEDLRRYLAHQPISARRDTVAYRVAKFMRRNWLAAAAVLVTVAGLSVGLFIANRQRVAAERRFTQLRQLSNKVFELDQAIKSLPGSITARRSLVSASLEYLEGLAADARGDVDLMREVADGYWRVARIQGVPTELNFGDAATAEQTLKKADAFVDRVLAARPADRAALLRAAVIAHDRMVLADVERRYVDVPRHARTAAARMEEFLRRGDASDAERDGAAGLYGNMALAYVNIHRYADAVPYARRCIELARSLRSPWGRVSNGLSLLANALRYQGDLDGALQAIREARQAIAKAVFPNEMIRMIEVYGVALREGLILGEDASVNANRPADAVERLQEAVDVTEESARKDVNDQASRNRVLGAARDLGNILRHTDPQRALAVFDLALRRAGEIRNNVGARRQEAVLLANSSYPLRALANGAEARKRIERAAALLTEAKALPAKPLTIQSEAYTIIRARADQEAADGRPAVALQSYQQLLESVVHSDPDPLDDLRNAAKLSDFYLGFAELCRRAGDEARAAGIDTRRRELWRAWSTKLPGNAFVLRQLADGSAK